MASLLWWILFFIDEFFIFRLESVICKKYTNTDGKDCKYTNAIDISIIWLYWRLLCRLYCRMYCRPYWRLFFVTQYFFFLLFHKCSKFMTLSDASRMFLSCYCFFLFFYHFYFTQNPRGYLFRHVVLSMFILRAQGKKVERKFWNPIFAHPFFDSAREKVKRAMEQLKKPQETFNNSLYASFKCGGNNVFSVAKQVQSADEGISLVSECRDCHNKWRDGWQR